MTPFSELPQTKKGAIGEALVDEYLRARGYMPYRPALEGSHPFDRLCASQDKRQIFIADAKTKPARVHYPDTGINIKHYETYAALYTNYKLHTFLFFVDEDRKKIYGNFLRVLERRREVKDPNGVRVGGVSAPMLIYPRTHNGIIYFPLVAMRDIGPIPEDATEQLRTLSTRQAAYKELAVQNGVAF